MVDTGADLSLISDKFLYLFDNKVVSCNVILKGLANVTVKAKISGFDIPMCFIFVSDDCLDYDVLMGRNVFEDESLATVTDHQGSRVVRRQLPGINRVAEDFGALVTEVEVPEEHHEGLEVILQDFSFMITTVNKVGAVNNVSLKIRLEKDIVVYRSTFLVSEDEKLHQMLRQALCNLCSKKNKNRSSTGVHTTSAHTEGAISYVAHGLFGSFTSFN
ncbi:unnamed protein product [Acanthoscelides obtectus]|uniref:Uncharacterized protein n=1 Tax=Acanthoscelides obtectus TaxID=200917 RepID=A0A9P0L859_ACAOB|nr:unnamed protein product [Acanthoscelides obtectus]CAK1684294.1 hypothetical protein AOBTE_LOCUS34782 [Acanthoscelides obtectus]